MAITFVFRISSDPITTRRDMSISNIVLNHLQSKYVRIPGEDIQ